MSEFTIQHLTRIATGAYKYGDLCYWSGFKQDQEGDYNVPSVTQKDLQLVKAVLKYFGNNKVVNEEREPVGWQCREYDVLEDEWGVWFNVNSAADASIYGRYPDRFQLRETFVIKE